MKYPLFILTGGFSINVLFIIEIIFLELGIFLNKFLIKDDFLGIKSPKSLNAFKLAPQYKLL